VAIIQDKDKEVIAQQLAGLTNQVNIVNFTQELECQYCRETSELVKELGGISDKVKPNVYNFITDKAETDKYKIEYIPATMFVGDDGDRGFKYYGIPSGYEFVTVLDAIKMVSAGESGLSQQTKDFLKDLKQPINLKVFVTPTCPYCPRAVSLAFQMAYESPMVTAEAFEAIEFPHISNKYGVQGVPRTVINDSFPIEGAAPEAMVVDAIKKAIAE
jgi:glutaredoxin-like protein